MVPLIIFGILFTATFCIHVIGYESRPKTGSSKLLLYLGLAIVFGMGGQFYVTQQHATQLRHELNTLQEHQAYSDVARYGATGLLGIAGSGLKEHTALNDILVGYVHDTQINTTHHIYKLNWDCSPEAFKSYGDTIELQSKLPFPYVYRAACEKKNNKGYWRPDIETARRILGITTQISGHHGNHDYFMKAIDDGTWQTGAL